MSENYKYFILHVTKEKELIVLAHKLKKPEMADYKGTSPVPNNGTEEYVKHFNHWKTGIEKFPFGGLMTLNSIFKHIYPNHLRTEPKYRLHVLNGLELDCIEIRDGAAYFKSPDKPVPVIREEIDMILNGFGNWTVVNGKKLNDSNQISDLVTEYLNSDHYNTILNGH